MAVAEIARKSPFDSSFGTPERSGRNLKFEVIGITFFAFLAYLTKEKLEGDMQQGMAILLAIVFVFLMFKNIVYGILALILAIGLSPDSVGFNNMRYEDYLLPPLLIIWFVQHHGRRQELVTTNTFPVIKVYMVILTISTFQGYTLGKIHDPFLMTAFYVKYVEYFVLFWFIMNNIKSRDDFYLILIASFMTCVMVAYIAYTNRGAFIEESGRQFVRASGPEGETPNILGGYYMFHMMIAFSIIFAIKNYTYKLALIGFLLVVAVPMLFTYSRTSFASLLFGLIITSMFIDLRFFILLGVLAVFSPILIPMEYIPKDLLDRYATILQIFDTAGGEGSGVSSWDARIWGWYVYATGAWNEHPLLGRGMGSIGLGIDSTYVKKFVESGLLGLVAFIMILVRVLREGLELVKVTKDQIFRAFGIGYLGGFSGMIIHSIGVSSFSTIRTAEPFWVFSGILIAVRAMVKAENELEEEEGEDLEEISFVRSRPDLALN